MSAIGFDFSGGAPDLVGRIRKAVHKGLGDAFVAMAVDFENTARQRFVGYSGPRNMGEFLQVRTGALRKSIQARVFNRENVDQMRLVAFSAGVPYAALQEFGGTVVPKPPRRFLTIPIADNLTPSGVARYPSAAALRDGGSLKTAVIKSRKGGLFIIGWQPGVKGSRKLLWMLVRSVKVPPRLGFKKTWDALGERRRFILHRSVGKAIQGALSGV